MLHPRPTRVVASRALTHQGSRNLGVSKFTSTNLKALYGRCYGIHSGQENTTYRFEIDKDQNLKRRVDDLNDTLLEIAVQEMKKAEAAAKAREANIRTVDA